MSERRPKVSRVEPTLPMKKRMRVAAYARVSTEKGAMLHSLAAQISYYSELIQSNPEYEYLGVYAEMCPPTMIQMHPPCTPDAP